MDRGNDQTQSGGRTNRSALLPATRKLVESPAFGKALLGASADEVAVPKRTSALNPGEQKSPATSPVSVLKQSSEECNEKRRKDGSSRCQVDNHQQLPSSAKDEKLEGVQLDEKSKKSRRSARLKEHAEKLETARRFEAWKIRFLGGDTESSSRSGVSEIGGFQERKRSKSYASQPKENSTDNEPARKQPKITLRLAKVDDAGIYRVVSVESGSFGTGESATSKQSTDDARESSIGGDGRAISNRGSHVHGPSVEDHAARRKKEASENAGRRSGRCSEKSEPPRPSPLPASQRIAKKCPRTVPSRGHANRGVNLRTMSLRSGNTTGDTRDHAEQTTTSSPSPSKPVVAAKSTQKLFQTPPKSTKVLASGVGAHQQKPQEVNQNPLDAKYDRFKPTAIRAIFRGDAIKELGLQPRLPEPKKTKFASDSSYGPGLANLTDGNTSGDESKKESQPGFQASEFEPDSKPGDETTDIKLPVDISDDGDQNCWYDFPKASDIDKTKQLVLDELLASGNQGSGDPTYVSRKIIDVPIQKDPEEELEKFIIVPRAPLSAASAGSVAKPASEEPQFDGPSKPAVAVEVAKIPANPVAESVPAVEDPNQELLKRPIVANGAHAISVGPSSGRAIASDDPRRKLDKFLAQLKPPRPDTPFIVGKPMPAAVTTGTDEELVFRMDTIPDDSCFSTCQPTGFQTMQTACVPLMEIHVPIPSPIQSQQNPSTAGVIRRGLLGDHPQPLDPPPAVRSHRGLLGDCPSQAESSPVQPRHRSLPTHQFESTKCPPEYYDKALKGLSAEEIRDLQTPILTELRHRRVFKSSNDCVRNLLRYFSSRPVSNYEYVNLSFSPNLPSGRPDSDLTSKSSDDRRSRTNRNASAAGSSKSSHGSSGHWWAQCSEMYDLLLRQHEEEAKKVVDNRLSHRFGERKTFDRDKTKRSEVDTRFENMKQAFGKAVREDFKTQYFYDHEFPDEPAHFYLSRDQFHEALRKRELMSSVYRKIYEQPTKTDDNIVRSKASTPKK